MRCRRNLHRDAVASGRVVAFVPGYVAAEEAAACGAGALPGYSAQFGGRGGELVEVGDCAYQSREAGGAAGETGGGGEVVFGYDAEGVG